MYNSKRALQYAEDAQERKLQCALTLTKIIRYFLMFNKASFVRYIWSNCLFFYTVEANYSFFLSFFSFFLAGYDY